MAGIAGVLGNDSGELEQMLAKIHYRGPDETWANKQSPVNLGCLELNVGGDCPDGTHHAEVAMGMSHHQGPRTPRPPDPPPGDRALVAGCHQQPGLIVTGEQTAAGRGAGADAVGLHEGEGDARLAADEARAPGSDDVQPKADDPHRGPLGQASHGIRCPCPA